MHNFHTFREPRGKRFAQLTRAETFSSLKTSDGEEVILSQPPPSSREDLSTVLSLRLSFAFWPPFLLD